MLMYFHVRKCIMSKIIIDDDDDDDDDDEFLVGGCRNNPPTTAEFLISAHLSACQALRLSAMVCKRVCICQSALLSTETPGWVGALYVLEG